VTVEVDNGLLKDVENCLENEVLIGFCNLDNIFSVCLRGDVTTHNVMPFTRFHFQISFKGFSISGIYGFR